MSVYNGGKTLSKALDSLISQTFADYELLVIDDVSTDNTAEILRSYAKKDSRIKPTYLKNKLASENSLIANFNAMLKIAKGKYIARNDDDDYSDPERLEKQVEYLDANSEVYVLGTAAEIIDEDGKLQGLHTPPTTAENATQAIRSRNIIYHSSAMFRPIDGLKYRLPFAEDYDLWLQYVKAGYKVANLEQVLLQYTLRNKSLSRRNPWKNWSAAVLAKRILKDEITFDQAFPAEYAESLRKLNVDYRDIIDFMDLLLNIFAYDLVVPFWNRVMNSNYKSPFTK